MWPKTEEILLLARIELATSVLVLVDMQRYPLDHFYDNTVL